MKEAILDTIVAKAEQRTTYANILKQAKGDVEKLQLASKIMTEAEAKIDDEFK